MAQLSVDLATNEILTWLRTGLAAYGGMVGDAKSPEDHQLFGSPSRPYWVLYQIAGGGWWGSPLVELGDVVVAFQLDSVGRNRAQAQAAASRARALMLGISAVTGKPLVPAPPGWLVAAVWPDDGSGPGGPVREGSAPTEVFTVPERYSLSYTQS